MKSKINVPTNAKRLVWLVFLYCYAIATILTIAFVISIEQVVVLDFVSFLTGASIIKSGQGFSLYDLAVQNNHQQAILEPFGIKIGTDNYILPYFNFPALALFFIPFLYLPFLAAYKIYVLILLFTLFAMSLLVSRIFNNISFVSIWSFIPFLYYPSIGSVFIGQTSVLLVLVYLLIYRALIKNKYFLAGVIASFLLLKIQYIISIPLLLPFIKEKKEFLKGFLFSSAMLMGVNFLIAGYFLDSYLLTIVQTQNPTYGLLDSKMFTLYASIKQMPVFSTLNIYEIFIINALFYFFALAFLFKIRGRISINQGFKLIILLTMVFSLHGVDYDLSLLLIPIFILISEIRTIRQPPLSDKMALFILILTPTLILVDRGLYISFVLLGVSLLIITQRVYPRLFWVWPRLLRAFCRPFPSH